MTDGGSSYASFSYIRFFALVSVLVCIIAPFKRTRYPMRVYCTSVVLLQWRCTEMLLTRFATIMTVHSNNWQTKKTRKIITGNNPSNTAMQLNTCQHQSCCCLCHATASSKLVRLTLSSAIIIRQNHTVIIARMTLLLLLLL